MRCTAEPVPWNRTMPGKLLIRPPCVLHRRTRIVPRNKARASIVNIRMFRRISRPVMTLAMAAGVIAVLASSPASAQGTPAQQAACQGDAMRLCGAYIPDVGRIKSCMMSQVKNLSPGCRAQMGGGGKKHARHYHHRRHQ
jgi:hypothetical protein